MSTIGPEGRSYLPIESSDLQKLAQIASNDRKKFFADYPEWEEAYGDRILCIALCQGAANHIIDGKTGINDFDVYTFYQENPKKDWYAKRKKHYDFADAKFGRSQDRPDFIGRRVDCFGRAITLNDGESVTAALRRYLQEGATKTAKFLALKAVVLLEPNSGTIVWTSSATSSQQAERS